MRVVPPRVESFAYRRVNRASSLAFSIRIFRALKYLRTCHKIFIERRYELHFLEIFPVDDRCERKRMTQDGTQGRGNRYI